MDYPDSILLRLRRETASAHQAFESALDLVSPQLSISRYVQILQRFYAAFEPWEVTLDESCPASFVGLWRGRRKAFRIVDDLAFLGESPDSSLEGRFAASRLATAGLWLGSLYVMEGATLGGQLISRFLETHFNWCGGKGYSFFNPYGSETAGRWQALCGEILASPLPANQIIRGAHQTYEYLERCLVIPE